MRKVLIVSPHFPPVNGADHQRIRMSLPFYADFGWEPTVLAVKPEFVEGVCDPNLEKTVPTHIRVIHTKAIPINAARKVGVGNFGLRCLPYLKAAGDELLSREKFDLVYFSTTVFPTMALGVRWLKKYDCPYILDFQDPWVSDYHKNSQSQTPPGGKLKYGLSQLLARYLEPNAVKYMSHAICVSPDYPKTLIQRYPYLSENNFSVLPFGAPELDFDILNTLNFKQNIFNTNDGKQHWVYVGRGGQDMSFGLRLLFEAIRGSRQNAPEKWKNQMLHFVGTSYAPDRLATKTIEPIANEFDLGDIVKEYPNRISYFEALQVLRDSQAIILIGSDDASYTASKLYPCILSRKPILAIFHENSSVVKVIRDCKAGQVITFNSGKQSNNAQDLSNLDWLLSLPKNYLPDTDWTLFKPYSAREMTRKQCEIFDGVLKWHGIEN